MSKKSVLLPFHHRIKTLEDGDLLSYIAENKESINFEERDSKSRTPLLRAVLRGRTVVVEELLQQGANVHALDFQGNGCLHFSAKCEEPAESVEITEALMEKRPNINMRNGDGETPAFVAAKYNNSEVLALFVGAGANVFIKNKDGIDLWQFVQDQEAQEAQENQADSDNSSEESCYDIMADFIEKRQLVLKVVSDKTIDSIYQFVASGRVNNVLTEKGDTLLHVVASCGCSDQAIWLLEKGADLYFKNAEGKMPIDVADASLQALFSREMMLHRDMVKAAKIGHERKLSELILEHGIGVDEVIDENKNTALHIAVANNQVAIVRKLLSLGADIDCVNAEYLSANSIVEQLENEAKASAAVAERYRELIEVFKTERANLDLDRAITYQNQRKALNGDRDAIEEIAVEKSYKIAIDDAANTMMHLFARAGTLVRGSRAYMVSGYALEVILDGENSTYIHQLLALRNDQGKTVIDCAREGGYENLVQILERLDSGKRMASPPSSFSIQYPIKRAIEKGAAIENYTIDKDDRKSAPSGGAIDPKTAPLSSATVKDRVPSATS